MDAQAMTQQQHIEELQALRRRNSELESSLEALNYAGNVIESMMDMLVVLNPDGTIRTVNEATKKVLGYTSTELANNGVGCILAEEEEEEEEVLRGTQLEKIVLEGAVRDLEVTLKAKDGTKIPVMINGSAMRNAEGKLDAVVMVARDMREIQRLIAEAEREATSEAIIEGMLEAVTIMDLGGTILHVNSEFERGTGWKRDEAVGKTAVELGFASEQEIRRIEKEVIPELMAQGFVRNFETTVLRRDGTEFTALMSWTLMKDTDGNPTGIINAARDITERKQAVDALKEKITQLNSFLNNIPDMAWLKDADSRFIAANKAFCEVAGVEQEVLLNNSCEVCFGKEAAKKFVEDDVKVMRGKKQEIIEEMVLDAQKNEVWLETIKSPILDESGEAIGTVGIARNITERKRAEKMRQIYIERVISAQDEERRRIARELHDETGQWIGSLVAGLSALESSTSDENVRKYAKDLRHMTSMTLREIQRMSRGLHPSVLDSMGLATAVERYAAEFSTSHGVLVKTEVLGLDGENRLSDVLETTIYRVVQEALTNVARHANAKTTSVFIVRRPSIVRVVVEDDGQGFEPDSAVDVCNRKQEGLGLISIRERVELLHGSMRLESSPGEGTTVAIEIPLGVNEP